MTVESKEVVFAYEECPKYRDRGKSAVAAERSCGKHGAEHAQSPLQDEKRHRELLLSHGAVGRRRGGVPDLAHGGSGQGHASWDAGGARERPRGDVGGHLDQGRQGSDEGGVWGALPVGGTTSRHCSGRQHPYLEPSKLSPVSPDTPATEQTPR